MNCPAYYATSLLIRRFAMKETIGQTCLTICYTALLMLFIGLFWDWAEHYKSGQIDALTGHIEYELITQDDSTRVWKKIE